MESQKRGTLAIIVTGKSEKEQGWEIECEIPRFNSRYPTKINRIPLEDASQLEAGKSYTVILEKGHPKKDKPADSPNLYDFWWNWIGFTGDGGETPPIDAQDVPTQPVYMPPSIRESREVSIERQVSLKEARAAAEWFLSRRFNTDNPIVDAEEAAKVFSDTITQFYTDFVWLLQGDSQHGK